MFVLLGNPSKHTMQNYFKGIAAIVILSFSGCASIPVTNISPDALHRLSDTDLALCYHQALLDSKEETTGSIVLYQRHVLSEEAFNDVEKELMRRGLTAKDLDLAQERKVSIGMSELALLASLGQPTKRNVSEYASGTHVQWVYWQGSMYVYTENGVVTSIQSER